MNILRPSLLPDELASSYEGRVIQCNGWSNRQDAYRAIKAWAGYADASIRETSVAELLAAVAGHATEDFVRWHTTVPLRRAISINASGLPHGSIAERTVLRSCGMRSMRFGAYFCTSCLEEDVVELGTPYWRRGHQLPGLYWCQKHGCSLSLTLKRHAFWQSPTEFVAIRRELTSSWIEELRGCEAIVRFLDICSGLASSSTSLEKIEVSRVARERAAELGINTRRNAKGQELLSDLLRRSYNRAWLGAVIPGILDQPQGKYCYPVDAAFALNRFSVSVEVFAATFALMYESADKALAALRQPTRIDDHAEVRLEAPESQAPEPPVDDDTLRADYLTSRADHRAIAQTVGLSYDSTAQRPDAVGLPNLSSTDLLKLHELLKALLTGRYTLYRAAKKVGLPLWAARMSIRGGLTPLLAALGHFKQASRLATPVRRQRRAKPSAQSEDQLTWTTTGEGVVEDADQMAPPTGLANSGSSKSSRRSGRRPKRLQRGRVPWNQIVIPFHAGGVSGLECSDRRSHRSEPG